MNRCAPQFLRPLSGVMEVGEGESILLDVRVHGRPLPEVEWFRNGMEIKQGVSQFGNGTHELRIPHVTQQHTGEYRCSAVNASGRVSSALWVAVVPTEKGKANDQPQSFYFENPLARNAATTATTHGSNGPGEKTQRQTPQRVGNAKQREKHSPVSPRRSKFQFH